MSYTIGKTSSVNEMIGFNITGNVMPINWLKHIRHSNGKPYLLACTILSDIVYWYRPIEMRDEQTGQSLGYKKKFKADKLQRSYGAIAEQYGFTKREVTSAVIHLESSGLIDRDLRTITINGTKLGNVLFIGLNVERLKQITFNDETNTDTAENPPPLSHPDTPPSHIETSEGSLSNVRGVTLKRETNTESTQRVPREGEARPASPTIPPPSHSLNANKPKPDEATVQALSDATGLDAKLKRNRKRIEPIAAELSEAGYTAEQVATHYGNEPTAGTWHFKRDDWRGKKGEHPTLNMIVETIGQAIQGRTSTAGSAQGSAVFDGRSLSEWWDVMHSAIIRRDQESIVIFQSSDALRHAYDVIGKRHGITHRDDRTQAKFNKAFAQFAGGIA